MNHELELTEIPWDEMVYQASSESEWKQPQRFIDWIFRRTHHQKELNYENAKHEIHILTASVGERREQRITILYGYLYEYENPETHDSMEIREIIKFSNHNVPPAFVPVVSSTNNHSFLTAGLISRLDIRSNVQIAISQKSDAGINTTDITSYDFDSHGKLLFLQPLIPITLDHQFNQLIGKLHFDPKTEFLNPRESLKQMLERFEQATEDNPPPRPTSLLFFSRRDR